LVVELDIIADAEAQANALPEFEPNCRGRCRLAGPFAGAAG
jgi:hypothetical protein